MAVAAKLQSWEGDWKVGRRSRAQLAGVGVRWRLAAFM
jgi:hypothetical protein